MHYGRSGLGRQSGDHQHGVLYYLIYIERDYSADLRRRDRHRRGRATGEIPAVDHREFVVVGKQAAYGVFEALGSERAYAQVIVFRHEVDKVHVDIAAAEVEAHAGDYPVERKYGYVCERMSHIYAEYRRRFAERHVMPEHGGKRDVGEIYLAYVALVGKPEIFAFELRARAAGEHEYHFRLARAAGSYLYLFKEIAQKIGHYPCVNDVAVDHRVDDARVLSRPAGEGARLFAEKFYIVAAFAGELLHGGAGRFGQHHAAARFIYFGYP